jgi:uroporphyrinogen decarboxylase
MDSIERFYATIERKAVDRPAAWLGLPHGHAQQGLFDHYRVKDLHELKLAVGDDFYAVDLPYHSDYSDAIYAAFDWYLDGKVDVLNRTLTADGCFKDCEEIEDLAFFKWPDPEKYVDPEECRALVDRAPKDKTVLGVFWSAHFQDTCAAFGMETAMMNMIANPEIVDAVNNKITDFYLKANEIFYNATRGKIHAVLIGNDVGSQRCLMLSPDLVRRYVIPGCRLLVEQAHSYGLKVIYHSCGSIVEAIPDFIDAGVDAIHPIQARAEGMEARNLRDLFAEKVSFCGGVDTQELLVNGSPEEVAVKVRELREIFPTGLIISPSHEAIQPDVPPVNVRALFTEATRTY